MNLDFNEKSNRLLTKQIEAAMQTGNCFERLVDFDDNSNSKVLFGDARSVAAFRNRRRCNLTDDGRIYAWQGEPNYREDGWTVGSSADASGNITGKGQQIQVMVFQPKFYYKVQPLKLTANPTTNGTGYIINKVIIGISDGPQPGYKLHPLFINEKGEEINYVFIGAFESSLFDRSTNAYLKYDTVADVTADTGDILSSVKGVIPASGKYTTTGGSDNYGFTRIGAETTARNRGKGWHSINIQAASANQLMMALEYSFNTQLNLGWGVATSKDNSSYNCAAYTGSTEYNSPYSDTVTITEKQDYPTQTGLATSTNFRVDAGATDFTSYGEKKENAITTSQWLSISYRGMENPYGNIWEFIQGMNIKGNGSQLGGIPYICTDYNYVEQVSDTSYNYKSTGITLPNIIGSGSWTKYFGYLNPEFDWVFIPIATGAPNDGTGVIGDAMYATDNLNGSRIALLGGGWSSGARAGAFYWVLNYGVGGRDRTISSRCMYIPVV